MTTSEEKVQTITIVSYLRRFAPPFMLVFMGAVLHYGFGMELWLAALIGAVIGIAELIGFTLVLNRLNRA